MKIEQAQALVEQIEASYAGRIVAKIEPTPKTTTAGCRVALRLVACNRRFLLQYERQLAKVLDAWQCYLLSEEQQQALIALASDQAHDEESEN